MKDINILIKPASGSCNMRCAYCFYGDELKKREYSGRGMMSMETAENLIRKALEYASGNCTFAFQGGEPTLRGLQFFRDFVETVKRYAPERKNIHYAIQTNGLLVDAEWAEFFRENNFLVGLSLDGTSDTHNLNRVDASGAGTYNRVLRAARLLESREVPFNILTVVTSRTARSIESIYRSYRKNRLLYQQYIPCLDPIFEQRGNNPYSLTPELFGDFLIRLFDLWYADRIKGEFIYIHYFESLAGQLLGYPPNSCGMMGVCSAQNVVEADGTVYPCDFYALDEYLLGNINTDSFEELDKRRQPFLQASLRGLEKCRSCRYGFLCHGGCRRDRQGRNDIEENYFCAGYMKFFDHALPMLVRLLRANGHPI